MTLLRFELAYIRLVLLFNNYRYNYEKKTPAGFRAKLLGSQAYIRALEKT